MSNNNGNSNQSIVQDFWSLIEYSFDDIKNVETKNIRWGFFVEQGINIFVAKAGEGKTLLLYSLAVQFLKDGKKVYYLDLDNPVDLPKDRGFPDAVEKLRVEDNHLVYLNTNHYLRWLEARGKGTIGKFLKEFLEAVDEGGIVFLDSVQNFIDTNDQKQTTAFMNMLRKYSNLKGLTFAGIHHIARTTGTTKGHTQIEDMADSVYMVKAHKKNSLVEAWSLSVSKQRYRTSSELTIKLLDDFDFEVSDVAILDDTTLAVLRFAVSVIRKSEGQVKQSDLRSAIKDKFTSLGDRKIFYILKDFVDRGLFIEATGVKNTKYYEVNEDSPYLSILFENDLSEVKKELLDTLKELKELPEIEIKDDTGSILVFKTTEAIKKHIWKMKDEEAKEILNKLKGNAIDNELDSDLEALLDKEEDDGYIPF
jgi:KaiC/GvpD/RAD55 family RecA-like ATPase